MATGDDKAAGDSSPRVCQKAADCPASLPALQAAFAEARGQQLALSALLIGTDTKTADAIAKRRHDAMTAVRSLTMAVRAIGDGYRFEDEAAVAKIAAMERAVQLLEREVKFWRQLLDTPP